MSHPNEERLRELYATFAKGDLQGFLAGCTDDVSFTVPGNTPGSGTFTKPDFAEWIGGVIGQTGGTFQERVLDVFANDDHAVLLLHHEFDRDGIHREYRTAHVCTLRGGKIATWEEQPGSLAEFESAWGVVGGRSRTPPPTLASGDAIG
ncbi:MAG TPA: nuclear transport factor 2 family protein [Acidimicrobiales bacterium]|nr:nuclear transport factor 2 family protein [Acidimicrobiales bacterium]